MSDPIRNREAFDKVRAHLLEQGTKSIRYENLYDGDGVITEELETCVYRGEDGTKCAVGVLIPDDEYNEAFDNAIDGGTSVATLARGNVVPALQGLDVDMLISLQNIHDYEEPRDWKAQLALLENGLVEDGTITPSSPTETNKKEA